MHRNMINLRHSAPGIFVATNQLLKPSKRRLELADIVAISQGENHVTQSEIAETFRRRARVSKT